jgi:cobalt/nickel transport system ATP-binding protein
MSEKPIIEINNLKYKYLSSKRLNEKNESQIVFKHVLKGISLNIYKGENVSIIGPNGAGKSTLLLNIAGLLESKYREGHINIEGLEINENNIFNIREKIGFVFQDPNDQLFSTTIFDDVAFGLINFLVKKKDPRAKDISFIRERVSECMLKVGLKDVENSVPYFLSFGEKKLAALATVLSYEPEIYILDEPSSNLDPQNRYNFIDLLKNMDKTIIIATHDLDMAYDLSGRAIVLNNGVVAYDGPARKVLENKSFLEANSLRLPLSFKKSQNSF